MKIFGLEIKKSSKTIDKPSNNDLAPKSVVYQDEITYGHSYPILNRNWDGEKTLGELGSVVRNVPDYKKLRLRSYDAFATIDTVKIIASKFFIWTIGSGLKLQSEPNRTVLKSEGIKMSDKKFTEFQKLSEARFFVYANSKESDFLKQKTLNELALEAYQMEFLGGDCLIVVRFDNNGPNIQIISGEHVCNPGLDTSYIKEAEDRGNYIKDGIEVDKKGSHIAFYVKTKQLTGECKYERIPANGPKSGKKLAWMLSGNKISPDHLRSVPAMSQSLEKINKLDRYTEAAVVKAEQASKIVYSIEHQEYSTGEGLLMDKVKQVRSGGIVSSELPNDKALADGLANRITETTSGQTFNMPNGAALKSFTTDIESTFSDFHGPVFKSISAGADVPSEVAMQEYNSNYSASRAAINSFGYIIDVKRTKFSLNFYIPFYEIWLDWQILSKKIIVDGYIENIDNFMVTKAYSQCRFTGKNMPHIDPLKEVKAVELMLNLKLISREQATEMLGSGQWDENFNKFLEEDKLIPKEEIIKDNSNVNNS